MKSLYTLFTIILLVFCFTCPSVGAETEIEEQLKALMEQSGFTYAGVDNFYETYSKKADLPGDIDISVGVRFNRQGTYLQCLIRVPASTTVKFREKLVNDMICFKNKSKGVTVNSYTVARQARETVKDKDGKTNFMVDEINVMKFKSDKEIIICLVGD